jgi:hypothetical protein
MINTVVLQNSLDGAPADAEEPGQLYYPFSSPLEKPYHLPVTPALDEALFAPGLIVDTSGKWA